LRAYVEAAKSVDGASLDDAAERCTAFMETWLNANPQHRVAVVKRLGGMVPNAEVV
jgi:broad specificity phosphatase PhoE